MFKKLLTASLALGVLAFPAGAGASVNAKGQEVCEGQTFEQAFKQFNDKSQYTLVPNGSFEGGLFGWDVTGNAVVLPHANEFRPDQGANALYMPAGSSVTSPPICVSKGYPYARTFVQRLHGVGFSSLKVDVIYPPREKGSDKGKPTTGNNGNGNGNGNNGGNGGNGGGQSPDGGAGTGGTDGGTVVPPVRENIKPAGFLHGTSAWGPSRKFSIGQGRIGRGTALVRFRFTVVGDASYLIDDLLVDPRCRR